MLPSGRFGRNVVIFGVDMNSSVHVDNKGKDILILGKGPTQGLGEHSLTAEKMYSVNFTDNGDKYCLSLHYNGASSYLFVNGVEIIKFKAKDSNVIATPLCLGNISKDWSVDNMKDTGLNGYVYDFSVDYDATDVEDIKDIHKYLMKKNNIVQNVYYVKKLLIIYKMGTAKQIDIKNRIYYFYNDMNDIKKFDWNLLRIDKKSYEDIGIYNNGYITIKKIDD